MSAGAAQVWTSLLRSVERGADRLPKAVELRNGEFGTTVASVLEILLPQRSAAQREAILRGVVRHRLYNRAIQVLHTAAPGCAAAVARRVPVAASPSAAAAMDDRAVPLIIASAHFGPLFFQALVLSRFLRDRRAIVVLHERALYLRKILPLVRHLGYEPVLDDRLLLANLRRALRDDRRTVVLTVFDHTHSGRRVVPFLAGALGTSNALGVLADTGGARVVSSFWEWNGGCARLVLDGPYSVDRALPPTERRRSFLQAMYSLLEAKVAAFPDQWSGWYYIAPYLVAAPPQTAAS